LDELGLSEAKSAEQAPSGGQPGPDVAAARAASLFSFEDEYITQNSSLSHRERLVRIYSKHNPDKVAEVDGLLQRYQGREDELVAAVERKYWKQALLQVIC
jgi:hypothetical protein